MGAEGLLTPVLTVDQVVEGVGAEHEDEPEHQVPELADDGDGSIRAEGGTSARWKLLVLFLNVTYLPTMPSRAQGRGADCLGYNKIGHRMLSDLFTPRAGNSLIGLGVPPDWLRRVGRT